MPTSIVVLSHQLVRARHQQLDEGVTTACHAVRNSVDRLGTAVNRENCIGASKDRAGGEVLCISHGVSLIVVTHSSRGILLLQDTRNMVCLNRDSIARRDHGQSQSQEQQRHQKEMHPEICLGPGAATRRQLGGGLPTASPSIHKCFRGRKVWAMKGPKRGNRRKLLGSLDLSATCKVTNSPFAVDLRRRGNQHN